MKRYVSALIFLSFFGFSKPVAADSLAKIAPFVRLGNFSQAYEKLKEEFAELEVKSEEHHFALARLSFEMGELDRAREYFEKSISKESLFQNWAWFYLGAIARKKNENKKAKGKLLSLAGRKRPLKLRLDSRRELALAALQRGYWKEARRHLYYLERRTRGRVDYPETLWSLVKAELGSKRKWKACRYARKLYSRFPNHSLVAHWGIDLQENLFENEPLKCVATLSDQRRRIKRLQWGGNNAKAFTEIQSLVERSTDKTRVYVDLLLARYHLHEGSLDEGVKLILKHYDEKKRSYDYLMLLAKASQKIGAYHAAVGSYEAAHRLNPRSRRGRKALFSAAFTSYQFRDYDGALDRFEKFQRKYRRSGLTRDVAWHIGWLKYLKGDYKGSYKKFSWIMRQKRRYRRRWRSFPADRIQYWMAMSLLRNQEPQKAIELFQDITKGSQISYYSLLSKGRLDQLKDLKIRKLAGAGSESSDFDENGFAVGDVEDVDFADNKEITEEEESEASIAASSDEDNEDEKEDSEEKEQELIADANFKSVKLSRHFERAKKLIEMGFDEDALWELYEIEKRARKEEQRKALMYHYKSISAYHRSSYIGEIYFRRQRMRYGLSGVRYLWEYTYPAAYKDTVNRFSDQFEIPTELTWAIMRAESRFRKNAVSPVGAQGLMQIMPGTAQRVGQLMNENFSDVSALSIPEVNVRYGTRYLQRLMKKFDQAVPLVAAAYNAGPHRVDRWLHSLGRLEMDAFIDHIPFVETRNYVKKVVRNYHVYQRLYGEEQKGLPWLVGSISARSSGTNFSKENWDALD